MTARQLAEELLLPYLVSVEAEDRLDKVTTEPIYVSDKDEILDKAAQAINALQRSNMEYAIGGDVNIAEEMESVGRDFQKLDAIMKYGTFQNDVKSKQRKRMEERLT